MLSPGKNCWRKETARRVSIAIDGEAYFRAVREAIIAARHSIFILGWDVHSKLQLVRDDNDTDQYPRQLGELLDYVASERGVDVYVLSWDFAMIYLLEREPFPLYALNWKTHSRLHFRMDDRHPMGASQHQKVVVVDDRIAFCGGIDLSKWRWDTSKHLVDDERRVDPEGKPYPPFHDMQMLVDADAAAALAELARERWKQATDEDIDPSAAHDEHDPWPASLQVLLEDVPVGIARTAPEHKNQPAIREIEQLYLDSIAAARQFIYIENQYLTAHCIEQALVERLQQQKNLEVVIIMPEKTGGWLEQHTMDVLRARLVKKLGHVADTDRLRLYYPQLASSSGVSLMVHAKFMIVDDCMLRVGSSNLSNRSMGLDCECDLFIEAQDRSEIKDAIKRVRLQLLAEHLDVSIEEIDQAIDEQRSLIKGIEILRGDERTLQPLDTSIDPDVEKLVPESALIDPEKPIDSETFVTHFVPDEHKPGTARRAIFGLFMLIALLALAAAWRWTALGEWLDLDSLTQLADRLNAHPATPLLAIMVFVLAASLAVPLTLLVVTSVLAFGPMAGFWYSLFGAVLSSLLSYGLGTFTGRDLLRRYAGDRLNGISKRLSQRGITTIIALRILPVAPFVLINLVAGASHISLRDFAIGTLLGALPGITAIALFADSVVRSIRDPEPGNLIWLAAVIFIILLSSFVLRKWLRNKQAN